MYMPSRYVYVYMYMYMYMHGVPEGSESSGRNRQVCVSVVKTRNSL